MESFPEQRAANLVADVTGPTLDAPHRHRGRQDVPSEAPNKRIAIDLSAFPSDWQRIAASCAPLTSSARTCVHAIWVPLRHVGWAASLGAATASLSQSNPHPAVRGLDVSVQHLRWARFYSAVGWALGGANALRSARRIWLEDPAWQALRRYSEDALALPDPLGQTSAMTLMIEGLLRPMLGTGALRRCVGDESRALGSHVDALNSPGSTRSACIDSAALAQWGARAASAALPLFERVWGQDTDEKLGAAMEAIAYRVAPVGAAIGRCA